MAYAINAYNEPTSCGLSELSTSAFTSSNWTTVSYDSSAYLTTVLSGNELTDTKVKFYPDIHLAGNYTVMVYTPGCIEDGSCSSRGIVNVTTYPKDNGYSKNAVLYQTNSFEKYDVIYQGYLDAISESFRPFVVLEPLASQTGSIIFVAEKVEFVLVSTAGGLNGLFEYDPSNYTSASNSSSTEIYSTIINEAGENLDDDAEVLALAVMDSNLLIGGNFSSHEINNFMAVTAEGDVLKANGGLNDIVASIAVVNDIIVVGGEFQAAKYNSSDTEGLSYIARYSLENDSWTALDNGVNGPVSNIIEMALNISDKAYEALAINGKFSKVLEYDSEDAFIAKGFALWLPDVQEWASRSDLSLPYMKGFISSSASTGNNSFVLAGELKILSLETSGGAVFDSQFQLEPMPFSFDSNSTYSSTYEVIKRDKNLDVAPEGAIHAVTYYTRDTKSFSVAGGTFSSADIDNNEFRNFIIYDDNGIQRGLSKSDFNENESVLAICNYNNDSLVFGGQFIGQVNGNEISSVAIWDLDMQSLANTQPQALLGESVQVNSLVVRPGTSSVVVGGSFSQAGNVSCNGLCIYDMRNDTWSSITRGVGGNVTSLTFLDSNRLVVAGNMTTGAAAKSYLAQYDFSTFSWNVLGQMSAELPGPVNAFATATDSTSNAIVAGTLEGNSSSYLWAYEGDSWSDLGQDLKPGTAIHNMKLLPLKKGSTSSSSSSAIPHTMVLLVMGSLVLSDFGEASAAFYAGGKWLPFVFSSKGDGSAGAVYTMFTQIQSSPAELEAAAEKGEHFFFVNSANAY